MFEPKGRRGVSTPIIGSDCMMSVQINHHCHGAVVSPANPQLRILLHSSIGPHGQQTPSPRQRKCFSGAHILRCTARIFRDVEAERRSSITAVLSVPSFLQNPRRILNDGELERVLWVEEADQVF
jgi:hypothetical protein